jgi:hypothetical protein
MHWGSRLYKVSSKLVLHAYLDSVTVSQDEPLPNIYSEWQPLLNCPLHMQHMHLALSGSEWWKIFPIWICSSISELLVGNLKLKFSCKTHEVICHRSKSFSRQRHVTIYFRKILIHSKTDLRAWRWQKGTQTALIAVWSHPKTTDLLRLLSHGPLWTSY